MGRAWAQRWLAAALILTGACGDILGGGDTGELDARVAGDDVVLVNSSIRELYYFPVEAGIAARISWAPCVHAGCPHVAAGASRAVPPDSIFGWDAEAREVLVYWWAAQTRNGRRTPGEVRVTGVRVR